MKSNEMLVKIFKLFNLLREDNSMYSICIFSFQSKKIFLHLLPTKLIGQLKKNLNSK